jgi:hypothetical protein
MRIKQALSCFMLCLSPVYALNQQISAPEPQSGSIFGTVTDVDGDAIHGAAVMVDGVDPGDRRTVVANDNAFFMLNDLHPSVSYHLTISAKGFAVWYSPSLTFRPGHSLTFRPGQQLELTDIKHMVGEVETTVNAVDADQLALAQVKAEEKQRILGIIPNFYVVYDHQFVPLTTKPKYQLAGIDQAADTPNYV